MKPSEQYGKLPLVSKVERIEREVQTFSPEELSAFRQWFTGFDAEAWDRQFEADVTAGKLDTLAERALRGHVNSGS